MSTTSDIIGKQIFLTAGEKVALELKISNLFEGCETEAKKHAVVKYVSEHITQSAPKNVIGFEEMSNLGLLWRINKEVLHEHGLALMRDPDKNISIGCLVAEDHHWEFSKDANKRNNEKYRYFVKNKTAILDSYLEK